MKVLVGISAIVLIITYGCLIQKVKTFESHPDYMTVLERNAAIIRIEAKVDELLNQ